MNYTITQEDIEAYLATKQDDEPIGTTCCSTACLVTEALRWKYQIEQAYAVITGRDMAFIDRGGDDYETLDLPQGIRNIVDQFDTLRFQQPTTKREWLEVSR